jgi:hypothetical protein
VLKAHGDEKTCLACHEAAWRQHMKDYQQRQASALATASLRKVQPSPVPALAIDVHY